MAQTTIQGSFLGDATVTGAKIGADFISAQTALTTGLATTDEIIVSDAGVIKRMDISVIEIAASQITASGTLPALNGAALTALNGTQVTSGTLPAARIAGDSIVEGKLNVSNGPTNGYVLTARDGVAGGFTWEAASAGASAAGNSGSVQFSDGSAGLLADNGQLHWDASNNRLGIGTASPSQQLEIANETKFGTGIYGSDKLRITWGSGHASIYGLGSTELRMGANNSNNHLKISTDGEVTMPSQPAVLAYNSVADNNVTGNGSATVIDFDTEVFDQGGDFASDVFTAPITGRYQASATVRPDNFTTAATYMMGELITSNGTFYYYQQFSGRAGPMQLFFSTFFDMDSGDTAYVNYRVHGMPGNTVDIPIGKGDTSFGVILLA